MYKPRTDAIVTEDQGVALLGEGKGDFAFYVDELPNGKLAIFLVFCTSDGEVFDVIQKVKIEARVFRTAQAAYDWFFQNYPDDLAVNLPNMNKISKDPRKPTRPRG